MLGERQRGRPAPSCPRFAHNAKLVYSRRGKSPLLSLGVETWMWGLALSILLGHFHVREKVVAFFFFFLDVDQKFDH